MATVNRGTPVPEPTLTTEEAEERIAAISRQVDDLIEIATELLAEVRARKARKS